MFYADICPKRRATKYAEETSENLWERRTKHPLISLGIFMTFVAGCLKTEKLNCSNTEQAETLRNQIGGTCMILRVIRTHITSTELWETLEVTERGEVVAGQMRRGIWIVG